MTTRMPEPLPDGLRAIGESASGQAWLSTLPHVLDEVAEQWGLQVGDPFQDASASLTSSVSSVDGTRLVLKLQFPHREAEQEAGCKVYSLAVRRGWRPVDREIVCADGSCEQPARTSSEADIHFAERAR